MFNHDFKESDKNKIVLKDISSFELFYNLLEFMYSDMTKINIRNVFDMLSLAEEYGVASYKEKCEILLSKYITGQQFFNPIFSLCFTSLTILS